VPPPPRPNPPSHVAHFAVHGLQGGVPWANTFWVRNGAGQLPTASDFFGVIDQVRQYWVTYFIEHIGTGATVEGCDGLYYGATGLELGSSVPHVDTGSMAGSVLPSQVATGIGWSVQQAYKGGHPRTYLPPPSQSALLSPRLFNPSFTTTVTSAANSFHSTVNQISRGNFSDAHLGTVSFVHQKAWRTPPVFRDFVPGRATVDQRLDTQRRRLGRDL
jgi:hypothetical protein